MAHRHHLAERQLNHQQQSRRQNVLQQIEPQQQPQQQQQQQPQQQLPHQQPHQQQQKQQQQLPLLQPPQRYQEVSRPAVNPANAVAPAVEFVPEAVDVNRQGDGLAAHDYYGYCDYRYHAGRSSFESQKAQAVREHGDKIQYSSRYYDDHFEYRHVTLPRERAYFLPRNALLTEEEWRCFGIRQSMGWEHFMIHAPEPHILVFKREKDYQLKYPQGKPANTDQENICLENKKDIEGGKVLEKGNENILMAKARQANYPPVAPVYHAHVQ